MRSAAYELYGGPVIVIDFRNSDNVMIWWMETAYFLSRSDLRRESGCLRRHSPMGQCRETAGDRDQKAGSRSLARETITSMQAGLVYGQIGQTEYIVEHMKQGSRPCRESKWLRPADSVKIIAKETNSIDVYDATLTLQGMRFIYERQKQGQADGGK